MSTAATLTPLPPLPKAEQKGWIYTSAQMAAYARQHEAELSKRHEAEIRVLKNALWKACGDDEESVNAYIESERAT